MSKIICDVCGTRYPETAEQCPICGHIHAGSDKSAQDMFFMDEMQEETHQKVRGGRFSKENVKKRTAGNVNYEDVPVAPVKKSKALKKPVREEPIVQEEDIFAEDKQNKKVNTILNVLLVIVILALLGVTGYILTQHVLPNFNKPEATQPPEVIYTEPVVTEPVVTEEPTYPCDELLLEETEVLMTEYQEKWLINVKVMPENTTDELTFTSADELIATVDSEGCITALAEGQTVITISCGNVSVEYNVLCLFPGVDIKPGEVPTDPPPTEPPVEYIVTSNYVNVRNGPDAEYDRVRQCMKNDRIWVYEIVYEKDVPWGRLEDGYICLNYAKEAE